MLSAEIFTKHAKHYIAIQTNIALDKWAIQGPFVQGIVILTSLLVVKMLTVLVITISNLQVFWLKKMWVAFANAKTTHIFLSKNCSIYALHVFNDQNLNDTLNKNIVSFEQLDPDIYFCYFSRKTCWSVLFRRVSLRHF